jgi:predicted adenine nucleotide alpha hydrolase (AANH) superfamily ATPase
MLLHICCAPDATVPWPALASEGYDVTGFFYGNNIHPECEWRKRRGAVIRLSSLLEMEAEISPYAPEIWLSATKALSCEPEGGARCEVCFGLQLESAAGYAAGHGFGYVCTTLSISPHKDPDVINRIGRAGADAAGVEWIERVWRKNDGFRLSVARSREMDLYRQNYCGCVYSAGRLAESSVRDGRRA